MNRYIVIIFLLVFMASCTCKQTVRHIVCHAVVEYWDGRVDTVSCNSWIGNYPITTWGNMMMSPSGTVTCLRYLTRDAVAVRAKSLRVFKIDTLETKTVSCGWIGD